ncbi:MAG: CBS domain-containing protein [Deltaproteobacteria bacterium]|nr:CBS domain-containing protein [Deltaproteobacteria bacterium]
MNGLALAVEDNAGRPTGIVTKLDMMGCRGEQRATAREVMMPRAMVLDIDATIADAARVMAREGFHHLLVVDGDRTLQGVISTFDITRWIATR